MQTDERKEALAEVILQNIGTPDDLYLVDIRQLWNPNFYRANIYRIVKEKITMTDSFFVQCHDDGPYFSPPLEFKYYDLELKKLFNGEPNDLVSVDDVSEAA